MITWLLIITMIGSQGGIAVVEYTTREYCEAARATIQKEFVYMTGFKRDTPNQRVNTICIEKK